MVVALQLRVRGRDFNMTVFVDDEDENDDAMDSEQLADFAYRLNADTHVEFQRRGLKLLVDFAGSVTAPSGGGSRAPLADLSDALGWSRLTLTSTGDAFFRAEEIVTFFDALVDGTLLDQFDNVLFFGAGPSGHAALSFALAAPLSRVLAIDPVTPPDALGDLARYHPGAENLETAADIWILRGPDEKAALACDNAAFVEANCALLGADIAVELMRLGVLDNIIMEAMDGTLTRLAILRALRSRRNNSGWLRAFYARVVATGRPMLEALVARNIAHRMNAPRYAARLEELSAEMRRDGIRLPECRTGTDAA